MKGLAVSIRFLLCVVLCLVFAANAWAATITPESGQLIANDFTVSLGKGYGSVSVAGNNANSKIDIRPEKISLSVDASSAFVHSSGHLNFNVDEETGFDFGISTQDFQGLTFSSVILMHENGEVLKCVGFFCNSYGDDLNKPLVFGGAGEYELVFDTQSRRVTSVSVPGFLNFELRVHPVPLPSTAFLFFSSLWFLRMSGRSKFP